MHSQTRFPARAAIKKDQTNADIRGEISNAQLNHMDLIVLNFHFSIPLGQNADQ